MLWQFYILKDAKLLTLSQGGWCWLGVDSSKRSPRSEALLHNSVCLIRGILIKDCECGNLNTDTQEDTTHETNCISYNILHNIKRKVSLP